MPVTDAEKIADALRAGSVFVTKDASIHCVGAALGFLTGDERPIPDWAERCHLGWLVRLISQPRMILPRIGIAFVLAGMVFMYRSELPRLRDRWTDL